MALKDHTDKLADLYSVTGADWSLHICAGLTEPVCPSAAIIPDEEEMEHLMRYRVYADTIEEAVEKAVRVAYRELVEDGKLIYEAPFTNPADKLFVEWLKKARQRLIPK